MRRARREQYELAFYLADIDCFKQYNDTYGHLAGASVLKQVATALSGCCKRPSDLVFRLGGEEFGILAVRMSRDQAGAFGHMLLDGVSSLNIEHSGNVAGPCITVSRGLFSGVPGPEDTPEDYFSRADKRLYQAKAEGRNRMKS